MEQVSEARDITPPYVPFKTFKSCLEKISGLRLDEISIDLLKGYGLSDFNAGATRQALQFLGIINEKGETTDKFDMLRFTGEQYEENLRKIIEDAYEPLFRRLNLEDANKQDIFNMLIHTYGCSRRVATTASSLLIGMCEWVGIRKSEGPRVKREAPSRRAASKAQPQKAKVTSSQVAEEPSISLVINLNIDLSAEATEEELNHILKRIRDAWDEARSP